MKWGMSCRQEKQEIVLYKELNNSDGDLFQHELSKGLHPIRCASHAHVPHIPEHGLQGKC